MRQYCIFIHVNNESLHQHSTETKFIPKGCGGKNETTCRNKSPAGAQCRRITDCSQTFQNAPTDQQIHNLDSKTSLVCNFSYTTQQTTVGLRTGSAWPCVHFSSCCFCCCWTLLASSTCRCSSTEEIGLWLCGSAIFYGTTLCWPCTTRRKKRTVDIFDGNSSSRNEKRYSYSGR